MKEHLSVIKKEIKNFIKYQLNLPKNNEIIYLYPSEVNKLAFIIFNGLIEIFTFIKIIK